MKREFIYLSPFDRNWAAYGLTDDELIELENTIMITPDAAKVIQGTGGLRKLRFPLPDQGKRGGARVLLVDFIAYQRVYVINVYLKKDQANISDKEKQIYKQFIDETAKYLKEGQ